MVRRDATGNHREASCRKRQRFGCPFSPANIRKAARRLILPSLSQHSRRHIQPYHRLHVGGKSQSREARAGSYIQHSIRGLALSLS